MLVHTPQQSRWFRGWRDGYMGVVQRESDQSYLEGYRTGQQERVLDQKGVH